MELQEKFSNMSYDILTSNKIESNSDFVMPPKSFGIPLYVRNSMNLLKVNYIRILQSRRIRNNGAEIQNMEVLDLTNIKFSNIEMKRLSYQVIYLNKIKTIKLNNCDIGDESCDYFCIV